MYFNSQHANKYNICVFYFQLHVAAANAYVEVMEFLLENDADIDAVDKDGWKPIHAAACWGNVSIGFGGSQFFLSTVEPRYNEGAKGLAKYVRYNKVSLYRGSFSYILL